MATEKEDAVIEFEELLNQDPEDDDLIQAIGLIRMSLEEDDPRAVNGMKV